MNRTKNIIVVCEGASEWTYLQRLNSFLGSLPYPEGRMDIPVQFIGKPHWEGVANGHFKAVEKVLRQERRRSRADEYWAWVDSDIYIRNDKLSCDHYRDNPATARQFRFSVHNFEDFLALHLDEPTFSQWLQKMTAAGHFKTPLTGKSHMSHFATLLKGYHKGSIPPDFITLRRLENLSRNLKQIPAGAIDCLPGARQFAESMLGEIASHYDISLG